MKSRKTLAKRLALLGLSAFSVFAIAGCGSDEVSGSGDDTASTLTKVVIGTQEMPNDEGIAKALGYFEETIGIEVELVSFDSGSDVNTALLSGSIDFGLLGSCPAVIAIANGYDVECIWVHDVLGSAESLVARTATGITTVADLEGKIIATPFASTAHFSLLSALETAGLTADDVTLLDMQPSEIYAAWETGQIDAAYVWDPTLSELSDVTLLMTSGDLADLGFMTSNVELVRGDFADEYPEIVEAYIEALAMAVELYQTDEATAISVIAEALETTEESAASQMAGSIWMSPSEQLDPAYFGTSDDKGGLVDNFIDTAEFLLAQGSITEVPDDSVFEAGVNPEFIEAVAAGE